MNREALRHRSVRRAAALPVTSPGGGFDRSVSLHASVIGDELSPFVDLTLFDMSNPCSVRTRTPACRRHLHPDPLHWHTEQFEEGCSARVVR